ncbi:GNAT family N-acetyltransferase [Jatrophihabitans sp.]|jgi:GNAT superfamily N-acetyltransferase|uniref:GNAT family N-acetyltransferase n=1 Tax=Jatrophihabitans sp. TaxID=1932789 RepID=UPI002EE653D1
MADLTMAHCRPAEEGALAPASPQRAESGPARVRPDGHRWQRPAAVESIRPAGITPELAGELAQLSRLAYAGSDPLPGLPLPDGQFETPAAVFEAVRKSGSVYLVTDQGRLVAALRARPAPGCWRVSRISVLPGYRRRGLVRLLLDAVARDARERQVDWLELDAVVERCLPPLYARLGFQVLSNWPSPDKPLSEVTMRRPTAEPATAVPLGWPSARLSEHQTVHAWWLSGPSLLRIAAAASGDPLADALAAAAALERPGLLLAGVDLCPRPAGPADRIRTFAGGRTEPEHLMPRSRDAETLALWRAAPGSELPLEELMRRLT